MSLGVSFLKNGCAALCGAPLAAKRPRVPKIIHMRGVPNHQESYFYIYYLKGGPFHRQKGDRFTIKGGPFHRNRGDRFTVDNFKNQGAFQQGGPFHRQKPGSCSLVFWGTAVRVA